VTPRLAVILAAGRGIRLGALGEEAPKGFLQLGGTTLIARSIDALRAAGIERVIIVTGHLAAHYERLAQQLGGWVTTIHNAEFAASGSLVSLACVGDVGEPYLLVESDLLYERRAPRVLLESEQPDLLLASGSTQSGDEVYVGTVDGRLVDLTKRRSDLRGTPAGELVGLTRISSSLHTEILAQAERLLSQTPHVEYETALVAAAHHRALPVLVVDDLVWTEVDDAAHLDRAVTNILPRIADRHEPGIVAGPRALVTCDIDLEGR
jgi:2-aminoethylphosphonate-pyruvate transaminase